jgi:uncharacterized metal-binding protein
MTVDTHLCTRLLLRVEFSRVHALCGQDEMLGIDTELGPARMMDDVTGRNLAVGLSVGHAVSEITLALADGPTTIATVPDRSFPENTIAHVRGALTVLM